MHSFVYPHSGDFPERKKRSMNSRDPNDALRPWSAITHGAGILLGLLGTSLLLVRSHSIGATIWHYTTFLLYGVSMTALYTASTLYHSLNVSAASRIALRKLDHCAIYLLIAGTYTPICLIPLRGPWGWTLLCIIWFLAALGLVLSLLWINAPRWITAGIYIFMGWLALIAIYPLAQHISLHGLFWLLSGGVVYTIGGVLYALRWPGRRNPRFGYHEIFHLFILAGSICHFMLMYHIVAYL